MTLKKVYDAFLSYNSRDRALVMQVGEWLANEKGMQVWLDKWNLIPADPWQKELEKALDQSKACVVFIGPNNLGPWQLEEMHSALDESVSKKTIRVVPVLLPGATKEQKESELPRFLRGRTWVEFGQSIEEEEARHYLVCGIRGISPGRRPAIAPKPIHVCPFRGLEVFREKDAPFFFGREALVQRLTNHVHTYRFLAMVGPSGSGKSSIVQAGVVPALRSTHQLITIFTPRTQPLTELAAALRAIDVNLTPTEGFLKRLQESEEALYFIARELAGAYEGQAGKAARVLIVVDQFEELFTQTGTEEERKQFVALLLKTKEKPNGKADLVITMRSDFIGKCAFYADLNTFINDHFVQLGPMRQEELRSAVEEPARLAGLAFETGLVEQILEDVQGSSGELPLLEYALLALYNQRKGVLLSHAAYQEIGGVEGALVKRANEEYNKLDPHRQEVLRRMFVLRLVQPGEGTEDTRRRATREELAAAGGDKELAEALINQWTGPEVRMLTSYQNPERQQDFIDVAHEALIRKWSKIKAWLSEDRQDSLLTGKLRQSVSEWQANQHDSAHLYHGMRLLQMEEFVQKHQADLTEAENSFIRTSIAHREAQRQREEERRNRELEAAQKLAQAQQRELLDAQKLSEAQRQDLAKSKKIARSQRLIVGIALLSVVAIGLVSYQVDLNKQEAQHQLSKNYWGIGVSAQANNDPLKSIHFSGEAIGSSKDANFTKYLFQDIQPFLLSPRLIGVFEDEQPSNGSVFNRKGDRMLTWSKGDTVRLRDAVTGRPLLEIKHEGFVQGATFSEDETLILSWTAEGTNRLWDAATGQPVGKPVKHAGTLGSVALDQNNTRLLTYGWDRTAKVWDVETGRLTRVFQHESEVIEAAFNKDGTLLFTWSGGIDKSSIGTARVWHTGTGLEVGQPMHYGGGFGGAVFTRDESFVLTWGNDGTARLWNVETRRPILALKHEDGISGATFNQDESLILTWSRDGTAKLWDRQTGRSTTELRHENWINGARFNKDETLILTWSQDGTARLWNAETGEKVGLPMQHHNEVNGADFSADESLILTSSWDKTARLWEAKTGQIVGMPMKHEAGVDVAVFNKEQTRILTSSRDGTVKLWEASTRRVTGMATHHERRMTGARTNKAATRILTWSDDGTARLLNINTGKAFGLPMQHNGSIAGATFSKTESFILTWSWDGTARVWDAQTGQAVGPPMEHARVVKGATFNEEASRVLTWSRDDTARVWDAKTGQPAGLPMKHKDQVEGAAFNRDETRILTWSDDGKVRLWDAKTGQPVGIILQHGGGVSGATFNQNEKRILTFGGTVSVWSAETGQKQVALTPPQKSILGAKFNKDESLILTWGWDRTVRVWDAKTGQPRGVPMHHEAEVAASAFNQDESLVLTWSRDGTARLWDAETGEQAGLSMSHDRSVTGARFNRDESRILTWSQDGTAKLWDAGTGQMVGIPVQHEQGIIGATFNGDETRILYYGTKG